MNTFSQIMAIEVAMRGVEGIRNQVGIIGSMFTNLTHIFDSVNLKAAAMIGILGAAVIGLNGSMEDNTFLAHLEGYTESAEIAANQLERINKISDKGVFKKSEIYEAVRVLDNANVSLNKNLDLVEKLGARSGNIGNAAALVAQIEGSVGGVPNLGRRLREFGITPEKLSGQGIAVNGNQVKGSKEDILKALNALERMDPLLSKLEGTLGNSLGALVFQAGELAQTLAEPLIKPLTEVVKLIKEVFKYFVDLNEVTDGWVGKLALGGALVIGLEKIWKLSKEILLVEKLIAWWAGIRLGIAELTNIQFVLATAQLWAVVVVENVLTVIETVRAFLAAAFAAAYGNFIPIALIAAAGIAVVAGGIALNNKVQEKRAKDADLDGVKTGNRPHRKDDLENIFHRMYGNAWTG